MPESVKEGLTEVVMKRVRVFLRNEEIAKLDRVSVGLGVGSLSSSFLC